MCDSQYFCFTCRLRLTGLVQAGRDRWCLAGGARTAGEWKSFREQRVGNVAVAGGGRGTSAAVTSAAVTSALLLLMLTRCRCREEHNRNETDNTAECGRMLSGCLTNCSSRFACSGWQCRDAADLSRVSVLVAGARVPLEIGCDRFGVSIATAAAGTGYAKTASHTS